MKFLLVFLVVLTGMGLSIEAGLLGPLGQQVGDLWATLSIFSLGAILSLCLVIFIPLRRKLMLKSIKLWDFSGGILGVIYVISLTASTPVIGVAMTMVGILLGQMMKSILIDNFGLYGMSVRKINSSRIISLALLCISLLFIFQG